MDNENIPYMLIRYANRDDAQTITENTLQLAQESENIHLDRQQVSQGVQKLLKDDHKGFYVIAEESNQVIGQAMITYEWSDWRNCDIWWLQSIYVHKNHRKKGVMKHLVAEIQKLAEKKQVYALRLYVHTKNTGAIHSYEKIGMKKAPYLIYSHTLDHLKDSGPKPTKIP